MCTTIEVGAGGIELLVGNGLLGPNEKNNKAAIQRAVEDALEQCCWPGLEDQGSLTTILRRSDGGLQIKNDGLPR